MANYANSITSSHLNIKLTPRTIYVNVPMPPSQLDPGKFAQGRYRPLVQHTGNRIRTSKYTLLTFIPKNLFEQFRRVANFFFLLLVIIQSFDEFRIVDPIIPALPVIFIVAVTAIKDAVEDYRRWKADKLVNNRTADILAGPGYRNFNYPDRVKTTFTDRQTAKFKGFVEENVKKYQQHPVAKEPEHREYYWKKTEWKNIRVGDIILMHNDQPIPADIIIVSTSEPDCICYVETKNLDGETNLKLKQGPVETSTAVQPIDCAKLKLIVESEPPTTNLLRYQATLHVYQDGSMDSSLSNSISSSQVHKRVTNVSPTTEKPSQLALSFPNGHAKRIPVDVNGLLHRGSVLRNTKWAIGVVVFLGEDTKQMMNSGKTPSKRSQVEMLMNPHVGINLGFTILVCFLCSFLYPAYLASIQKEDAVFMEGVATTSIGLEGFLNFWATLILFQNIVPISLYISIEFVKTMQAYFIFSDLKMYYEKLDMPCQPKSWNLSDNLGQVEYVFSDKTGTLTRNIMEFKKCSIDGVVYDGRIHKRRQDGSNESISSFQSVSNASPLNQALHSSKSMFSFRSAWLEGVHESLAKREHTRSLAKLPSPGAPEEPETNHGWYDPAINDFLINPDMASSVHGTAIRDFFTLLSVCHTVLVDDKANEKEEETLPPMEETVEAPSKKAPTATGPTAKVLAYKAQSPDEACLVTLAAEMGFVFKGREQNSESETSEVIVDALGKEMRYTLLHILEFDSDRKRMSVIARTPSFSPDKKGDVIVFCKGADSIIYERLMPGQTEIMKKTTRHLERFAQDGIAKYANTIFLNTIGIGIGLRTLCLAYRKLSPEFYEDWSHRFEEASAKIYPDPISRTRAFEGLNDEVETKLVLLGATAIEDKLQEGVPECITTLASAGIKIWVLTGDKIETAVNVGFLCGLLKPNTTEDSDSLDAEMIMIQVKNANSDEEIARQLKGAMEKFFGDKTLKPVVTRSESGVEDVQMTEVQEPIQQEFALIIDGQSLKYALESEEMKALLLELGCRCKAVICCRVSPLQKAKVVEMVKQGKRVLTLAIGDGANDVSMIQAADVGVGISGEEGLQAVMCSDYAIAQFRYLTRLLLVHGRWSYSRTSYMILNFYVKNLVFTMVLFWFQFFTGFSSSVIYEFTYMILYNIVFTNLPILVMGVFDQDGSDELLTNIPRIYGSEGISQSFYSHKKFALYFLESIWQSVICFFLPMLAYGEVAAMAEGYMPNGIYLGTSMAMCAIWVANLVVAADMHSWTWMTHLAIWGSSAVYMIYIVIYFSGNSQPMQWVGMEVYEDPKFHLTNMLTILLALLPRFLYYYTTRIFKPTDSQIFGEFSYKIRKGLTSLDAILTAMKPVNLSQISVERAQEKFIQQYLTVDPQIQQINNDLVRKPSAASNHSYAYSMEKGIATAASGFSFAHTKGMGDVVLRSPLSALVSGRSRQRSARKTRQRSADGSQIEKTVKTSRPQSPQQSIQVPEIKSIKLNAPPASPATLKRSEKNRTTQLAAADGMEISVTAPSPERSQAPQLQPPRQEASTTKENNQDLSTPASGPAAAVSPADSSKSAEQSSSRDV